jgi:hypothetical protein
MTGGMMAGWRWAVLCLVVGLGVVVMRVFWDGHAALVAGDEALARGDIEGAVVAWRRAARWYAPAAPHVATAYERLETLAREADAHQDRAGALLAWRAIRSSALATRSFYQPYADKLDAANERIAVLMAAEEKAADPRQDEEARRKVQLALLVRDDAPNLGFTVLALVGFAAWVGGGFWFARRGVSADDQLDRRTAIRSGLLVVAGLGLWMLGLYNA